MTGRLLSIRSKVERGHAVSAIDAQWLISVLDATRKDRDYWLQAQETTANQHAALTRRVCAFQTALLDLGKQAAKGPVTTALLGAYAAISKDLAIAIKGAP